jgi:hypothetical protein
VPDSPLFAFVAMSGRELRMVMHSIDMSCADNTVIGGSVVHWQSRLVFTSLTP